MKSSNKSLPIPDIPTSQAQHFLRYLATLQPGVRFDSRLLHQHLEKSAKRIHQVWIEDFIAPYYQGMGKFGELQERKTAEKEIFYMLTPQQASLLVIYDGIEEDILNAWNPYQWELVFHTYQSFQDIYPPDRYAHAWGPQMGIFVAHGLDSIQNATREELLLQRTARATPQFDAADKSERAIEHWLGKELEERGISVRHQVICDYGIADIVTPDAIYEVKARLDKETLFTAIGQVLVYRAAINPTAKAFVVGRQPKKGSVNIAAARSVGVDVIIWER